MGVENCLDKTFLSINKIVNEGWTILYYTLNTYHIPHTFCHELLIGQSIYLILTGFCKPIGHHFMKETEISAFLLTKKYFESIHQ